MIPIIWGKKLFGRIYEVENLFVIATQFFHLWYFPLIPMGTYLIFEEHENGFRGVKLPFSAKYTLLSIFVAYLRGIFVLAGIVMIIITIVMMLDANSDQRPILTAETLTPFLLGIGSLIIYYVSQLFLKGSPERANEIAQFAGLKMTPQSSADSSNPSATTKQTEKSA